MAASRSQLLAEEQAPDDVLVHHPGVHADHDQDSVLGSPGRPFERRNPFFIGLTGALGVALAYTIYRGLADIASVLVIIGLALFIAIGLNPIMTALTHRSLSRGVAVAIVVVGFLVAVGVFVLLAVPPVSHEVDSFTSNYPKYKAELVAGKGWAGHLATRLHLTSYLTGKSKLTIPTDGIIGAGKAVLSLGVAAVSVVALTIYFLIALPGVTDLGLSLIPRSRRIRAELLTDEVYQRVGGFMLGNLVTSVISGVLTYVWLLIVGVPYALLLALFVAIFDLIPVVGSTIAGIVVSLVALTKGVPIALATAGFYVLYRFVEDYLVNPRVMKHTVKVSPGLTIIATLIGGSLLGIVGALVAIPFAATIRLILDEVTVPRQNSR